VVGVSTFFQGLVTDFGSSFTMWTKYAFFKPDKGGGRQEGRQECGILREQEARGGWTCIKGGRQEERQDGDNGRGEVGGEEGRREREAQIYLFLPPDLRTPTTTACTGYPARE
jgi:hypothetical protein